MFHMVNKLGNVHKFVKDARKRDELIALGYHVVEEPVEEERGVEDPLQMHTTEDDTQGAATDEDDTQATAAIGDDIEEGAQATAEGDNATEDDAQVEVNPKKRKTKKNAAEE
ncbi:MAG: hypothetical protein IKL13_00515 [Clostridia bacterium]|nr:hypothetical protein [Clostridia bacterium]